MSTDTDTVVNLTTKVVRGIHLPIKTCGDIDFNFWSCNIDDMKEQIRYLKEDFVVRESDVFICTYPRSGTNWTNEIVTMLLQGTPDFAPLFAFAEALEPKTLDKMASPRVICTHLPLQFLPPRISEKAKIICVFRNPKDVAVSLHNFNSTINFLDYNATWAEYLQLFLTGEVPSGKWFDHVKNWRRVIRENKPASIFTLKYEDIKTDLLLNIEKIAEFLEVTRNPELFSKIAEKCDFKCQYKERTTNVPDFVSKITKNTPNLYYRKGEVGDWKNWFTVAQDEQFEKIYEEQMKDSDLKLTFCIKS